MLLPLHIALALGALIVSTVSLITPSSRKITLTYVLTILTLLSAGGLVLIDHASMGRACLTAFAYVTIIAINVFFSKRKLSSLTTE